jgi:hypothetical protein
MAYLRWSWSPWYVYSHIDGGDGNAAVLVIWHAGGARAAYTAGELLEAGCSGRPEQLRALLASCENIDQTGMAHALEDLAELVPAVDEFLFEIVNAGRIPMPLEVAGRYRELRRLIRQAVNAPRHEQVVDARGFPMWFAWCNEIDEIHRRHPPPRVPKTIRDLISARAVRAMKGEVIPAFQDTEERALIATATEWPAGEG